MTESSITDKSADRLGAFSAQNPEHLLHQVLNNVRCNGQGFVNFAFVIITRCGQNQPGMADNFFVSLDITFSSLTRSSLRFTNK